MFDFFELYFFMEKVVCVCVCIGMFDSLLEAKFLFFKKKKQKWRNQPRRSQPDRRRLRAEASGKTAHEAGIPFPDKMGFRFARLAARAAASRRGMIPAASARRALSPPTLPAEPRCGPHWFVPARGHVGHSHHHGGEDEAETSERIFRLGLAADVVLTVGKAVTGYLSGSTAIAADAAHSLSDIVCV